MAFPTGWNYQCAITIPHGLVTASLSNIPWILQAAAMPTGATGLWANCNSDGSDIRFTSDSAGTIPLHMELQNWNIATPTATFYINIPSVNASTDTTIYVWYGNSGATAPAASDATWGSQGVWDSNYVGVWHMDEAAGANLLDSTANGYTLPQVGSPGAAAGMVGGARTVDGLTQYFFNNSTFPSLDVESLSIEMWLYPTAVGIGNTYYTAREILILGDSSCALVLGYYNNQLIDLNGSIVEDAVTGSAATLSAWSQLGVTKSASGNIMYLNGSLSGTGAAYAGTTGGGMSLAANDLQPVCAYSTYSFAGSMDEVRISNSVRSADWIKTGYNNQNNLSTSATPGAPIPVGVVNTNQAFMPLLKAH
jgi:hypothetical protein